MLDHLEALADGDSAAMPDDLAAHLDDLGIADAAAHAEASDTRLSDDGIDF